MRTGSALLVGMLSVAGCCTATAENATSTPLRLAGPGFTPSPTTAAGLAGGPRLATALASDCGGNVPLAPQHRVTVGATIPRLRILVNAGSRVDTTLALVMPDGSTRCTDDSDDPGNPMSPVLELIDVAPGEYGVYVGAYRTDDMFQPYNIGFTEAEGAFASSVVPSPR